MNNCLKILFTLFFLISSKGFASSLDANYSEENGQEKYISSYKIFNDNYALSFLSISQFSNFEPNDDNDDEIVKYDRKYGSNTERICVKFQINQFHKVFQLSLLNIDLPPPFVF